MKPHKLLLLAIVAALLAFATGGCAALWASIKSTAAPAGGGAAGAALGSLAGPAGTIGGAAIGAALGDAIEENASLRSGATVGEGALENEIERWALNDPKGIAKSFIENRGAYYAAKQGEGWVLKWFWRVLLWAAGITGLFVFVRRQWIGRGITGEGVVSRPRAIWHAITGGDKSRVLALGFDPLAPALHSGPGPMERAPRRRPAPNPRTYRRSVTQRRKRAKKG